MPVAAPVDEVVAFRPVDVAEGCVARVARPTEDPVAPANPSRKEDAVAVEGDEGILELMERDEVVRPADADRGAVIAGAPRDPIAVAETADARVVGVRDAAP